MNNLWLCKGDNLTHVLLERSVRTSKRNSGKRTKIFLKIWNENGFTCAWLGLRFVVNGFYKILPPYLVVCKRTNEYNATRRWRMIFDKILERTVSIFPCLLKFTLTFPSNYCTNLISMTSQILSTYLSYFWEWQLLWKSFNWLKIPHTSWFIIVTFQYFLTTDNKLEILDKYQY